MGKNNRLSNAPLAQNQNDAMSDDPQAEHRLTDKPGPIGQSALEKPPAYDEQDQATVEEFGREGMGVAAKE